MTGSTRDPAFSPQVSHAGWVSPLLLFSLLHFPSCPSGQSARCLLCTGFLALMSIGTLCVAFDSAMGKTEVVQRNQEQAVLGQAP